MPGGVMQLIAVGQQDQYLTGSPTMSYWRTVTKKHTNFAMESVRQTFTTKPFLDVTGGTTFTCRIGRVADLLANATLVYELPSIYSSATLRFRWIKNLAHHMIASYAIRMDTQLIDQGYGEWMDIWNELSLPPGKKYAYERMTGQTEEFVAPKALEDRIIIENNQVTFVQYPEATATAPSILGRQFFLPLPFWFSRNPSLALPLIGLQYQNVDVTLEFRGIEQLYQIYDERTDEYVAPGLFRQRYSGDPAPPDVSISAFTRFGGGGSPLVDLSAYLECTYVFLDTEERSTVATTPMDYLVERVYRSEYGGVNGPAVIDLTLTNPVKELLWFTRRSDAFLFNEWANYTATNPENDRAPILATAKIMWNGMDRLEEKPGAYFNMLQPYEYHTNTPRQGIYTYSFALFPEKNQPSGAFNASKINKIQMYVNTNPKVDTQYDYEYDFTVFSLYYNIFRVIGGSGGMVFAN